jgi:microcystin degradation protein MlrC
MRIGIAGLWHETNTFALEHNDQMDADVRVGQEVIATAHPKSFIGGFVQGARQTGIELVPAVEVRFTHGGLVHANVYEAYREQIVTGLASAGPLDAVYFALHGAMAAEDPYTDAEGGLLQAARKALGDIPFVATYDFHAIMTDAEVATLAALFPNDTNPHIDAYERGLEAAGCLLKILQGEVHPISRRIRVPIIGPNIGQSTWAHNPEEERKLPLYQLNQLRAELEKTPGVVNLSILGGYGYADTPDSSMSVIATTDGDPALADRLARRLAAAVWDRRHDILNVRPIYPVDEGVRLAMKIPVTPVMLVDLGDDPGSCCPADSPAVLESLIRQGARDCAVTLRDPNAVRIGMAAGVGATVTLEVGAGIDRRFYQPITVTGVVKSIDNGDYTICGPSHGGWGREVSREAFREAQVGPRVVLRIGNKIDVIFSEKSTGKDRDFFKSAGIVLEEKQMIVVKSNQAHRASFDPVATGNIQLASPGVSTVAYETMPYKHLQRPVWPVDRDFQWEVGE